MILVCCGDSWTQGDSPAQNINWEATKSLDWYDIPENFSDPYNPCDNRIRYKFYDSEVWPKVLGRNFNVETYNVGRLGSDNYGIVRRTINTVEDLLKKGKENIKVVVGWTSMLRIPIFTSRLDKNDRLLYLEQVRPFQNNLFLESLYDNPEKVEDAYALCILCLQNYLETRNIDYRFYQAFDPFVNFNSNRYSQLINEKKWIYNDPSKAHFKQYISNKYDVDLNEKTSEKYFVTGHPTELCHTDWGNHLYDLLKDDWS